MKIEGMSIEIYNLCNNIGRESGNNLEIEGNKLEREEGNETEKETNSIERRGSRLEIGEKGIAREEEHNINGENGNIAESKKIV